MPQKQQVSKLSSRCVLIGVAVLVAAVGGCGDGQPKRQTRPAKANESANDDSKRLSEATQQGLAYLEKADWQKAEALLRESLALAEKIHGSDDPETATALNNLAGLLQATNRLAEAEPMLRRALAIDEQSYGPQHPLVAIRLNNLAQLLQATNRVAEAEPLMRRALAIDEQSYGADHPNVAICLNNLAGLLQATNRLAEAEPLMRRALAIDEQSYGAEHPKVAIRLNNLAQLLKSTNRLAEAEPLMRRHVEILVQFGNATGHQHPHIEAALANYATLLQEMDLPDAEIAAKMKKVMEDIETQSRRDRGVGPISANSALPHVMDSTKAAAR